MLSFLYSPTLPSIIQFSSVAQSCLTLWDPIDYSMQESHDQPRQHFKKQRHNFVNRGPAGQSYGFSSGQVWMWELDHKESWALKNWCFWTVVLEKTLESPLDCKGIQPVHPKENQSWIFFGRTDAEAGHLMQRTDSLEKTLMLGKTEDRRRRGRQRMRWLHGITDLIDMFEQAPGVADGQGSLVYYSPWDCKELDMTECLNWTELCCICY